MIKGSRAKIDMNHSHNNYSCTCNTPTQFQKRPFLTSQKGVQNEDMFVCFVTTVILPPRKQETSLLNGKQLETLKTYLYLQVTGGLNCPVPGR